MEKLAIIGTGVAGMGAAWFLSKAYDITVFEKNNYVGGHTNTLTVDENGKNVHIDTGFMVFNKVTYPNLTKLFSLLDVEIMPTSMSFSVQNVARKIEFCGSGLSGLFAQKRNLLSPSYIRFLMQINRFNKECLEVLSDDKFADYSLHEYITEKKLGNNFLYNYLIPMSSAVWSTPPDLMLRFPARALVRFFYNHGFLGLNTQHQWYTVVNGSRSYRDKIITAYKDRIKVSNGAVSVRRDGGKVYVCAADGSVGEFDKVILASHADESLDLLSDATYLENRYLSCFNYQLNRATLHTDASVMPRTRSAWSSWNYRIEDKNGIQKTSTIYYMNMLQKVSRNKDYFVSIEDPGNISPEKIISTIDYHHPLFDLPAIRAQENLQELNRQGNNTYFCGSYFKYGFHEDAFTSAVELSRQLLPGLQW